MKKEYIELTACVVGTGAAGYNAAIRLKQLGCDNIAIVTEGVTAGTSRNTGSDKQTYYKLGLGGDTQDSVLNMARDLFAGGCVDGDNALCEAALSARCFLNLCELGVPFPTNRYGEYIGYKTDHDPYARATSAGPLTSKFMTEALEKRAEELGITVYDDRTVVEILKKDGETVGLIAVSSGVEPVMTVFSCNSVIMAVGGPAGIYSNSVYPAVHHGSSGVIFETGAKGQNLTEWQYGIASTQPRWNVSGTYMQVLPRFVSVDSNGNEHEFLTEYFKTPSECLSMVFLKGYQWPFDCKKVMNGSSVIDLLVYREEMLLGRKVYLDFRSNPYGLDELDYGSLDAEAREYLEKAGCCFGTPIMRLEKMNSPAVSLYLEKGIDLHTEMLPISLSAQHNNGGIAVDMWWQTDIKGLFVCGEAAGTHGITRPGGSALNAGQVGSLRAAQYVAKHRNCPIIDTKSFKAVSEDAVKRHESFIEGSNKGEYAVGPKLIHAMERMSRVGAAMRSLDDLEKAKLEAQKELSELDNVKGTPLMRYLLKDVLVTQIMYLGAMADYCRIGGGSRGSFIIYSKDGELRPGLDERFRFFISKLSTDMIQECSYKNGDCIFEYRPARKIPEENGFFENVWRDFRINGNIY